MVFAADYPLLDVFWTILIFFSWIAWIWILVVILTDVFRRRDIGGFAKAAWVIFMIVLPFIGVLAYLISQHDAMAQRGLEQAQAQQQQFDEHVRAVAAGDGAAGPASEIEKAHRLLEQGAIDQ